MKIECLLLLISATFAKRPRFAAKQTKGEAGQQRISSIFVRRNSISFRMNEGHSQDRVLMCLMLCCFFVFLWAIVWLFVSIEEHYTAKCSQLNSRVNWQTLTTFQLDWVSDWWPTIFLDLAFNVWNMRNFWCSIQQLFEYFMLFLTAGFLHTNQINR